MSGRGLFLFWLTALLVAGSLIWFTGGCDTADASPFGYKYYGTVPWIPATGSADNTESEFDCIANFGRMPDCLVLRSSADWRMFIMSTTSLANSELMHTTLSAAQLDSLYDQGAPYPAEGYTVFGFLPWLVAPASSDTIWVDCYVEE